MKRRDDWEFQLRLLFSRWRAHRFEWGHSDCARFAADAVFAVTGTDVSEQLGRYANEIEAQRVLDQYGGLTAAVDKIIGNRQDIVRVRRGDLVQLTERGGGGLAVSAGMNAVALTEHGLREFPMPFYRYAWKVG